MTDRTNTITDHASQTRHAALGNGRGLTSIPGPCVRLLAPRLAAHGRVQPLRDMLERVALTLEHVDKLLRLIDEDEQESPELQEIALTLEDLSTRVSEALGDDAVAAECIGPKAVSRALSETSEALVEADRLMLTGELVAR